MKQGFHTFVLKDLYVELSRLLDRYNSHLHTDTIYPTDSEVESLKFKIKSLGLFDVGELDEAEQISYELDEKGQIVIKVIGKSKEEGSNKNLTGKNNTAVKLTSQDSYLKGIQTSFNTNINTKLEGGEKVSESSMNKVDGRLDSEDNANSSNQLETLEVKVFHRIMDVNGLNLELFNFQKSDTTVLLIFKDTIKNKDLHKFIARLVSCYNLHPEYQGQDDSKCLHVTRIYSGKSNKELDLKRAVGIIDEFKASNSFNVAMNKTNFYSNLEPLFLKYSSPTQDIHQINMAVIQFLTCTTDKLRLVLPNSIGNGALHRSVAKLAMFYHLQPVYVGSGAEKSLHLQRNSKSQVPTDLSLIDDFLSNCQVNSCEQSPELAPPQPFVAQYATSEVPNPIATTSTQNYHPINDRKFSVASSSSHLSSRPSTASEVHPKYPSAHRMVSPKISENIRNILRAMQMKQLEYLCFDFAPANQQFCKEMAVLATHQKRFCKYTGTNDCKKLLVFPNYQCFLDFKAKKKLEAISKAPWRFPVPYKTFPIGEEEIGRTLKYDKSEDWEPAGMKSNANGFLPTTSNVGENLGSVPSQPSSNEHSDGRSLKNTFANPTTTRNENFNFELANGLPNFNPNATPFTLPFTTTTMTAPSTYPTSYPYATQPQVQPTATGTSAATNTYSSEIYPILSDLRQGYELPLNKTFYQPNPNGNSQEGGSTHSERTKPFVDSTWHQGGYNKSTEGKVEGVPQPLGGTTFGIGNRGEETQ